MLHVLFLKFLAAEIVPKHVWLRNGIDRAALYRRREMNLTERAPLIEGRREIIKPVRRR